jgi:hypothetical protein
MLTEPAEPRLDAGICAVKDVPDTKVVPSATPFHSNTEVGMKPLPDAVIVIAAFPATAEFGVSPLRAGLGLFGGLTFAAPPPPQPTARASVNKRKATCLRLATRVTTPPIGAVRGIDATHFLCHALQRSLESQHKSGRVNFVGK